MSEITEPIVLDSTAKRMAVALEAIADGLDAKKHTIYGFHIDGGNSDPDSCVTYLADAVGLTPAYMDFDNDTFDYGSWENAFFMPKPCMLKSNGEVDYYLDPDNYAYKEDGVTASDVADTSYDGNAMMEWDKIYWKIVPNTDTKSADVYIANYQADDDYQCWSNINNQGVLVDHFYTPIYNGAIVSSKLRSISGLDYSYLDSALTASAEMTYAQANNAGTDILWNTEVYADVQLINLLLILIGKSTNVQTTFGYGRYGQTSSASSMLSTGTMDAKGLFWGANNGTYGVKVFGMENWWGNQWRRFAGIVNDNGNIKVKLTYGKQDGSTTEGYVVSTSSSDYTGYISTGVAPSGSSGGYISAMKFTEEGMLPSVASGSSSTYYCDGLWFNNIRVDYAFRGGSCINDLGVGAFCFALNDTASSATWAIGASVSCKPLA